jgi:HEAT repeat protein
MTGSVKHVLIIIIFTIIALILMFLFATVTRRIRNARRYAALDRYREACRRKIKDSLKAGAMPSLVEDLRARPLSLQWRAVEEVLFEHIANRDYAKEITRLFEQLGYRAFYESKLKGKQSITKTAAIDKLGKMLSESSTASLVKILNAEEDPEILTVTVRALCRIGNLAGLKAILARLPELYAKSLVSQKTIEASLINHSAYAVPVLIARGQESEDPKIKASLLRVLSHLPAIPMSLSFAEENLTAHDAEVRAGAIRVFGSSCASSELCHPDLLLPLLEDPVWFVRLQTARALEQLRYERSVVRLGTLLLDPNWQVRNAAARALANIGDASLAVFLNVLKYRDRYAKESICEEAERTNFTQQLIENLSSPDAGIRDQSRQILGIMHSLHFSTPLYDYLTNGDKEATKQTITRLMAETASLRGEEANKRQPGYPGAQRSRIGIEI